MKKRVRVSFGNVEFSGYQSESGLITVPRPAFVKILRKGQVKIRRDYSYTDDYAWDNANNFGKRDNIDPAALLSDSFHRHVLLEGGRFHGLIWLDPKRGELHYSPHSAESYTIEEVV